MYNLERISSIFQGKLNFSFTTEPPRISSKKVPFTLQPPLQRAQLLLAYVFCCSPEVDFGPGRTNMDTESQDQPECYRANYHIFGRRVYLTSEWGITSNSGAGYTI